METFQQDNYIQELEYTHKVDPHVQYSTVQYSVMIHMSFAVLKYNILEVPGVLVTPSHA